jgi:hypothetical protein
MRANGRYRALETPRASVSRQTRLLIGVGLAVMLLAGINIVFVNAEMDRIEAGTTPRFAEVGNELGRVIPTIITYVVRGSVPIDPPTADGAVDPKRTRPYLDAKRGLERWIALFGLGLGALIVGVDQATSPPSPRREGPPSSLGSDVSRVLVMLSLAYAGLSFFEG